MKREFSFISLPPPPHFIRLPGEPSDGTARVSHSSRRPLSILGRGGGVRVGHPQIPLTGLSYRLVSRGIWLLPSLSHARVRAYAKTSVLRRSATRAPKRPYRLVLGVALYRHLSRSWAIF